MAKRIKVMEIIARMNVGGPAVIVAELMRGIDPNKFEVLLVTGYCDETEADYLDTVATDIKATRIEGLGRSLSLKQDVVSFFSLVRLIRREKPDVIHTHTAKAGVLGRLASIIAGKGTIRIHTFHGHLLHGYFGKIKTYLVIIIERILAKKTHRLVAVGTQVRDDLLRARIGRADKFVVSFPGLKLPATFNIADERKKLNLDSSTLYCTFVGRLTNIKRPDRLLDVASITKARGLNIHFLIAGDGELAKVCQERIVEEKLPVTLLGWRKDIDEILASSDMAILTSDNEGIPLTLIQASLAGLPIVATKVGSISDIVLHGETGFLTETNPTRLADAMAALVVDPGLRKRMGEAGRQRAMTQFTARTMVSSHEDLYTSTVRR
jgi:glycosyltransferase involved in cell wall biosynthesis